MPPTEYFPFDTLEANTLPSDVFAAFPEVVLKEEASGPLSWLWNLFGTTEKHRTDHIKVTKYVSDPSKEVNLATALQYSTSSWSPSSVNTQQAAHNRLAQGPSATAGVPRGLFYTFLRPRLCQFRCPRTLRKYRRLESSLVHSPQQG